jgi:ABC-type antimicrobial peptide transport system permease subunit
MALQAAIIAVAGSALGLCSAVVIQYGFSTPIAPLFVPAWLSLSSCAMIIIICLVSSVIPYLRLRRIDPLSVFHI